MRLRLILLSMLLFAACAPRQASVSESFSSNKPAKNVILFIGDGMGVSTVTAARIFVGQKQGSKGEEYILPFERFENVALVKTYNTNQQVSDSAGTATAMHTGVKTKAGVIGLGPSVVRGKCESQQNSELSLVTTQLHQRAMQIGMVPTTRITHATPATLYAISPERNWESDLDIPLEERDKGCRDIAAQLLDFPFRVALGGGAREFRDKSEGGKREKSLMPAIEAWLANGQGSFVSNKEQMLAASEKNSLLGLFSQSHMDYMADPDRDPSQPTLTEMTMKALDVLKNSDNGYYLMVEGGRIDHGHHMGKAGYALRETEEFADAVAATLERVDLADTLVLVTADHSHVLTISGYPTRGNDILGLVYGNDEHGHAESKPKVALDNQPYTTLGYWNGPGARVDGKRPSPETGMEAQQQAVVLTGYKFTDGQTEQEYAVETHSGEDVALYATGAGSHRVRGVIEQNKIYDIIRDALELH